MATTDRPNQRDSKEMHGRIKAALRGAFSGPPTPLKDIPKKNGESRNLGKVASKRSKAKRIKKEGRQ